MNSVALVRCHSFLLGYWGETVLLSYSLKNIQNFGMKAFQKLCPTLHQTQGIQFGELFFVNEVFLIV